MANRDDNDGCTPRLGQRGVSEQGGGNLAHSEGTLEGVRIAQSLPLSTNTTAGDKKLGKRNWQSGLGQQRAESCSAPEM